MATIKKFEDMEIWQLSRELCKEVYGFINLEEFSRDYGLKDQINKSSGSVMDNIAEGFGRGGNTEFKNFLTYSVGASNEVQSQLYRALDRGYISKAQFDSAYELAGKVSNKAGKFVGYLNNSALKGMKFRKNPLDIG
jgi:four helix bundle protein